MAIFVLIIIDIYVSTSPAFYARKSLPGCGWLACFRVGYFLKRRLDGSEDVKQNSPILAPLAEVLPYIVLQ